MPFTLLLRAFRSSRTNLLLHQHVCSALRVHCDILIRSLHFRATTGITVRIKTKSQESKLYPIVARWMRKQFRCFKTGINVGLRYSRVDVLGVRDVGGDLSGEVETIAIEVKRGAEPFATASGQALGYQVYVNRVYLADVRETTFKPSEIDIASHLGIGLVQIKDGRCREVLSSPHHNPITRMSLELIERMALGKCQMCGSFFEIGTDKNKRFAKLSRENFDRALANEKGLMFWNRELSERKAKLGVRVTKDGMTYERRYICPDCIGYVLAQVGGKDKE